MSQQDVPVLHDARVFQQEDNSQQDVPVTAGCSSHARRKSVVGGSVLVVSKSKLFQQSTASATLHAYCIPARMMSIPFLAPKASVAPELTQEETWQARQRCQGELCPWCILDARHGYLGEAHARATKLLAQLPDGSRPESSLVLQDAVAWCEKISKQYPCEPPPPFTIFGPPAASSTGGASSSSSRIPPTQLAHMRHPETVAASRYAPAARQTASTHAPAARQSVPAPSFVVLNTCGVPVPGYMDRNWVFECWTGPKNRWVAYTEPTQEQLRRAYNNGEGVQWVEVNSMRVLVSVAPGDMWQNNPDTENPSRKVRICPKGGWPE